MQWRKTIGADRVSAATESIEIERFCTLAASIGRTSPIFEAMLASARNPSADVELKLAGTSYFCPWVDGPGEFSVPFGLQTRHGYLVFVFVTDGALYKQFRDISAEVLVEGYTMTSTVILANSERQLLETIALRLPPGKKPRVVVEGTNEFDNYMNELREDTIWPE